MDIKKRWQLAQQSELKHHRKKYVEIISRPNHRSLFNDYLKERFDTELKFFQEKDVLEIGCGTYGMIYFLNEAKSRIGIEPMEVDNIIENWQKPFVKKGIGEELPFENNSFDVILILNCLDHVIQPSKVISESYRVLRSGGKLFVHTEVLTKKAVVLRHLLNKFDTLHPHHMTEEEYMEILSRFHIIHHKTKTNGFRNRRLLEMKVMNFLFAEVHLIAEKS